MDAGPEPRDTPKLNRGTVSLVMPFLAIYSLGLLILV